ncbi:MAG TPA: response regulator [Bryobacteraceae bacterium]|jgi:two-component system response regulator|nr:response regulator [Bryobacteraceae bacterium]
MSSNQTEILLVEDDPQDVELTLRVLRTENIKVAIQVARDGEEALDYLFRRGDYSNRAPNHQPSLILLDLKLPKVNGLQVIEQIKASDETRTIPVVVLTSSGEQKDIVESYRLGANSYVQKPVGSIEFRQAIKTLAFYWTAVNQVPVLQIKDPVITR